MEKNEKHISIIVETIEGEAVEVEVNIENKVSHLMEKAMKELSIDLDSISSYEILYNGKLLSPESKIEEYAISDKGVVLLQRRPKVG